MADQKRWFKVWTSLALDMDHLPNAVIGAWTRLGCRTALVGNNGVATFENWAHLARFWNVTVEEAHTLANALPSVCVEEGKTRYGELTVTFKNWLKYQDDSTVAQRMKSLRYKRRGDKTRREKTREDEKRLPPLPPQGDRPEELSLPTAGRPETPSPDLLAQYQALVARIGRPVPTP